MTFRWNNVQLGLKEAGALVYAMDQGQTAAMTQPGPWGAIRKTGGYCAGLAARWIAFRYVDRTFKHDKNTLVCENPGWKAVMAHNEMLDSSSDFLEYSNAALAPFGLKIDLSAATSRSGIISGRDVTQMAIDKPGCYYIYICSEKNAHVFAIQRKVGRSWRVFDANYGEFKCKDRHEFRDTFDDYINITGYDRAFGRSFNIARVFPPPYINTRALDGSTKFDGEIS